MSEKDVERVSIKAKPRHAAREHNLTACLRVRFRDLSYSQAQRIGDRLFGFHSLRDSFDQLVRRYRWGEDNVHRRRVGKLAAARPSFQCPGDIGRDDRRTRVQYDAADASMERQERQPSGNQTCTPPSGRVSTALVGAISSTGKIRVTREKARRSGVLKRRCRVAAQRQGRCDHERIHVADMVGADEDGSPSWARCPLPPRRDGRTGACQRCSKIERSNRSAARPYCAVQASVLIRFVARAIQGVSAMTYLSNAHDAAGSNPTVVASTLDAIAPSVLGRVHGFVGRFDDRFQRCDRRG